MSTDAIIKDKQATWIKADGTVEKVDPADGRFFTLEELKGFVGGGYIEIKRLQGYVTNKLMVLDEEGKMSHRSLPENKIASAMYNAFHVGTDWIAGDVLVCEFEQVE